MAVPHVHKQYRRFIVVSLLLFACDGGAGALSAPELARSKVSERTEKIVGGGGLNLAVYEAGRPGAPAIVFIHGFTQNFMTWDQQFSGLADRFHVVAYDFRGHGASDKPLEAQKYTDSSLWADDLAAVIRSRNLRRPVLVGWSYGGYIIADYVRKYGDAELGGLVFVDAVTKAGTEEASAFFTEEGLRIFPDVLSPDMRTSMNGALALARMFAPQQGGQQEIAFGSAMMVAPEIRLAMFSRVLDNDDVLRQIKVPALVVQGLNDRIVRLSAAQHTARTIPGAKLLTYDSAGHAPHLDTPARFNRDLAAFVRSGR
jgi:non-heme chloroperoxidase